jgi:hypothetical protein
MGLFRFIDTAGGIAACVLLLVGYGVVTSWSDIVATMPWSGLLAVISAVSLALALPRAKRTTTETAVD